MNAAQAIADARTALEHGANRRARDLAWRAAASAARIDDKAALQQVIELAGAFAAAGVDDAEQLRIYAEAALEDAVRGTRPRSAFERLISRDKRPR